MTYQEAYRLVEDVEPLVKVGFIPPKDERSNPDSESFDPLALIKEKL